MEQKNNSHQLSSIKYLFDEKEIEASVFKAFLKLELKT